MAALAARAAAVRAEERRRAAGEALDRGAGHLQARSEILRHFLEEAHSGGGSSGSTGDGNGDGRNGTGATTGRPLGGFSGLLAQLRADAVLFWHPSDIRWQQARYRLPPTLFSSSRRRLLHRWWAAKRLLLRLAGLACLPVVAVAALVWVPATALFAAYSVVFPLAQLGQCWDGKGRDGGAGDDGGARARRLVLPCVLSHGYLACLALLLGLAPLVGRFQRVRRALRDAKGFPLPFYRAATVGDVYRRYAASLARVDVARSLHAKVGRFNALEIVSYLKEANRGAPYV
jgi:hypothetical protein